MKKALKIVAATVAVWGVAAVGTAQAAPGGASYHHDSTSTVIRMADTGWGPV